MRATPQSPVDISLSWNGVRSVPAVKYKLSLSFLYRRQKELAKEIDAAAQIVARHGGHQTSGPGPSFGFESFELTYGLLADECAVEFEFVGPPSDPDKLLGELKELPTLMAANCSDALPDTRGEDIINFLDPLQVPVVLFHYRKKEEFVALG
jgi:hypothetical protein